MEPEWNISEHEHDAHLLGIRNTRKNNQEFMSFLIGRKWIVGFSLKKRRCYISNEDITWKLAYIGRKSVTSILHKNQKIKDDIWISKQSFKNLHFYK